jgi:hypothetical protein
VWGYIALGHFKQKNHCRWNWLFNHAA